MIDIENTIFNLLATRIREVYPEIFVSGEYTVAPPKFPCVTIEEKDNTIYQRTITATDRESHSMLMYEINIYSDIQNGKKAQAKEIRGVIDDVLTSLGFTRLVNKPLQNISDNSIYRIFMRYTAVVGKNNIVYRN